MRLLERLKALEQRQAVTLPAAIFFEPTAEEIADFEREFPGRDCICFVPDEELQPPKDNTLFLPLLTSPQRRPATQ